MAIWVCVATAFVLAIWSRAYHVIVSISTIGLYASYGLPIVLALRARAATVGSSAVRGTLGRWSAAINVVAVVWIVVHHRACSCCRRTSSPAIPSPALLVLLAVYYFAWARTHFAGPPALKRLRETAIPTPPVSERSA